MALLTVQNVSRTGIAPAFANAAGGGDEFLPDIDTFLHAKNGSAGALTVTVVTPREAFPGAAIADIAVSVPAGGERVIGPFPAEHFASPADGNADVTYSGVTNLTLGVFKLSKP